jgi:hypothetical protein
MLRRLPLRLCSSAGSAPLTGAAFMRKRAEAQMQDDGAQQAAAAAPQQQQQAASISVEAMESADSRLPEPSTTTTTTSGVTGTLATVRPPSNAATRWMEHSSWAALGEEFKHLSEDKFLQPSPQGFLTARAVTSIQPAEEVLSKHLDLIHETYKGMDVRDPKTAMSAHQGDTAFLKTTLTFGDQSRAVAEFMSGHIAHQVALTQWQKLFDLHTSELDLMYWLWIIHLHIISRRAITVNIDSWSRRREVLQEMLANMFDSWARSSEEVMGRAPLTKIKNYIRDMYYVVGMNLDEALLHDGPGGDMMLMGCLMKFCPLPRPEDVPVFTYYTLVHYIRFHTALLDRLPDEEFAKGNFHFLPPDDRSIFAAYTDVQFDQVARSWMADGAAKKEEKPQQDTDRQTTNTGV